MSLPGREASPSRGTRKHMSDTTPRHRGRPRRTTPPPPPPRAERGQRDRAEGGERRG